MPKNSPHHSNEVWRLITESLSYDPDLEELRVHVDDIAREFAAAGVFQQVDGAWILPMKDWEDWLRKGGANRYLRM